MQCPCQSLRACACAPARIPPQPAQRGGHPRRTATPPCVSPRAPESPGGGGGAAVVPCLCGRPSAPPRGCAGVTVPLSVRLCQRAGQRAAAHQRGPRSGRDGAAPVPAEVSQGVEEPLGAGSHGEAAASREPRRRCPGGAEQQHRPLPPRPAPPPEARPAPQRAGRGACLTAAAPPPTASRAKPLTGGREGPDRPGGPVCLSAAGTAPAEEGERGGLPPAVRSGGGVTMPLARPPGPAFPGEPFGPSHRPSASDAFLPKPGLCLSAACFFSTPH